MQGYIFRRLLLFIPTLLLASLIIFGIMRILPGDVAVHIMSMGGERSYREEDLQALRDQMGLNDPLVVQYSGWLWSMVRGDFGGTSLVTREHIGSLIARQLPVTVELTLLVLIISTTVSLPLGVLAAVHQERWADYLIRISAIFGQAMPNFWVGLMLILGSLTLFSWTPPVFYTKPWEDPWNNLQMMIFPALILAWGFSAYMIRLIRATMLEVLRQDYIRTARSKGLKEGIILWRHALRNVLIPAITLVGVYLGALLGGTVIMEIIFGLPGMGQAIVEGAFRRDYPVVQSMTMVLVFLLLTINLLIDIAYAWIDPRISYT